MIRSNDFQETPIYDALVLERLTPGLQRLADDINAVPVTDELAERREQRAAEEIVSVLDRDRDELDRAMQRHPAGKQRTSALDRLRGPNGRFVRPVKDQPQA